MTDQPRFLTLTDVADELAVSQSQMYALVKSGDLPQVDAVGNIHDVVFPSALGTLRDPAAVHKQWRRVRTALNLDWVTSHTFRKTLATLLDAQGLSARIGADQLGHSQVSMTQNVYMGRKTTHSEGADVLDQILSL